MQFTFPNYPRQAGKATARWVVSLGWLLERWQQGKETTSIYGEYFVLWCPVDREEFPY